MNYYGPVITDEDYEKAAVKGITKTNVYQRVHTYGWSIERAITEPLRSKGNQGKHGKMMIIAESLGISPSTYFRRIRNGMTPKDAASKPKGHTIHLEIARGNGISDICFYKRVERGMHPYLAATKPMAKRTRKKKQIS
ncbi:hypothetical protein COJ38_21490 [Bacillus cereus]|uniref:hypothetical protein n=1 Tax=Bacillus TaxID=1386 RepID=UPI000BF3D287|nr:hypothetical protein [Bacillus cereus]MYW25021.1 hypothetical protein [Bacillus thuringiensis]MYW25100.1 hypothetical protein [Bacillus thuringiensis]PFL86610.1 hypothetical protein COJ38_21490 [Bacillus cereus]PFV49848.1 hypothetical protein COL00_14880 [Bacillus cereus]